MTPKPHIKMPSAYFFIISDILVETNKKNGHEASKHLQCKQVVMSHENLVVKHEVALAATFYKLVKDKEV